MCKNYYRIWFSPHYGNVEGGGGQSNFAVISRKSAFNSSKYLLEKKNIENVMYSLQIDKNDMNL